MHGRYAVAYFTMEIFNDKTTHSQSQVCFLLVFAVCLLFGVLLASDCKAKYSSLSIMVCHLVL